MKKISVKDVDFSYGEKRVLDKVNFALNDSEIVALLGPSGIGKSTLLKLLSNLLPIQKGEIAIEENVQLAYMAQEDLVLPWRTVLENISLPLELGSTKSKCLGKAEDVLQLLQLTSIKDSFPEILSGGMKKLVSLARTLLVDSDVLLLDEPFSSVDVHIRERLFAILKNLRNRAHKTVLFVTHDFRDACALADRILFFAKGNVVHEWSLTEEHRTSFALQGQLLDEIRSLYAIHHPFVHL